MQTRAGSAGARVEDEYCEIGVMIPYDDLGGNAHNRVDRNAYRLASRDHVLVSDEHTTEGIKKKIAPMTQPRRHAQHRALHTYIDNILGSELAIRNGDLR